MNFWPLKLRFGIYAAALTSAAVVASTFILAPVIYRRQLAELDEQLEQDSSEVFADLENYGGPAVNFRKPVSPKYIPISLRLRYLQFNGPEGQLLYRSPNLRGLDLATTGDGLRTLILAGQKARIGTFNHGYLTVHIGTRLGRLENMQADLFQAMQWTVPVSAAVVLGAGWLLGRRALRPVTELTTAAEKIDASKPDERLPLPRARDEIFRLTEVLNRSFDRLQNAYEVAARFSADASHQLKTPLSVLRAGLDDLRNDSRTTPEQREEILTLLKQTRRLTTLVEDLLLLAQADAGRLAMDLKEVNLAELVREMLDDVGILCDGRGLQLQSETPETLSVMGDARRIAVVLQNLGENAAKYAGEGGQIRICCQAEGSHATVRIANTGPSIAPEQHERLFDRFHRGAAGENNSGHGLGLNIARTLALAQGGDVRVSKSGDGWTEFEFWLPLISPQNAGAAA